MGRPIISYEALRPDWFANGSLMARALQREMRKRAPRATFVGFPRQWLPLFAWVGASWRESIEPSTYVPLISGRSEAEIVREIRQAQTNGQLRLLVEVVASAEIVLCETLQRMDCRLTKDDFPADGSQIRLTTWHGYNRADVRAVDTVIADFRPSRPDVLFIPCAKARPYNKSRAYQRLMRQVELAGLNRDTFDMIVITSLGPIPEAYWETDLVQRYDTGVRDIYRLLVQCRALLKKTHYRTACDLMTFAPYSDLLRILHLEGYLPKPMRLPEIGKRNIPVFRTSRPTA